MARLNNRRYRDVQRLTTVEGLREVGRALAAGIVPQEAYVCAELLEGDVAGEVVRELERLARDEGTTLFEVTLPVFSKMAYRGSSGGILLVIPYQESSADGAVEGVVTFLGCCGWCREAGEFGSYFANG